MSDDALSSIVSRLSLRAGLFVEADYCGGSWAVDTSGQKMATFHLVQDGDCWLHMPDEEPQRLHPGDLVFFPRDARHLLTATVTLPEPLVINEPPAVQAGVPHTRMLCGYFEFLSRARWPLFDELPEAIVLNLQRTVGDDTKPLIDLILSEAHRKLPGSGAVLQQLAYVLLIYILRKGLPHQGTPGLLQAFSDPQIGRALQLMHDQPEQQWSLRSLAQEVGMSRASFAAKFHEAVEQPAMQYLTAWRMQVAIDLLTTTRDSMYAVSQAVGYSSEAAFRNAFAKQVGESPGRFRRRVQSGLSSTKIE